MYHIKLRYENGLSAVYNEEEVNRGYPFRYSIFFNDKELNIELILDVDGYYHVRFQGNNYGVSSWVLRTVADMVDEINKPMDEHIEEYFKNNPVQNDTDIDEELPW